MNKQHYLSIVIRENFNSTLVTLAKSYSISNSIAEIVTQTTESILLR